LTARTVQLVKNRQNCFVRTSRTGARRKSPGQLGRAERRRQPEKDKHARQIERVSQNRTGRTRLPGQNYQNRIASTGPLK
jgi:hypothetical protein